MRFVAVEGNPYECNLSSGLHPYDRLPIVVAEEQLSIAERHGRVVRLDAAADVAFDVSAALRSLPGGRLEHVERGAGADQLVLFERDYVDDAPIGGSAHGPGRAVGRRELGDRAIEIDAPQPRKELVRVGIVRGDVDERPSVRVPFRHRVHEAVLGQPARLAALVVDVEDVDVLHGVVEHADAVEPPDGPGHAIGMVRIPWLCLRPAVKAILRPSGDQTAPPPTPCGRSVSWRGSPPSSGSSQSCAFSFRDEVKATVEPSGEIAGRRVRRVAERQPAGCPGLDVEEMQVAVFHRPRPLRLAGSDPCLRETTALRPATGRQQRRT